MWINPHYFLKLISNTDISFLIYQIAEGMIYLHSQKSSSSKFETNEYINVKRWNYQNQRFFNC